MVSSYFAFVVAKKMLWAFSQKCIFGSCSQKKGNFEQLVMNSTSRYKILEDEMLFKAFTQF